MKEKDCPMKGIKTNNRMQAWKDYDLKKHNPQKHAVEFIVFECCVSICYKYKIVELKKISVFSIFFLKLQLKFSGKS